MTGRGNGPLRPDRGPRGAGRRERPSTAGRPDPARSVAGRRARGGHLGSREVVDGYVRRFIMDVVDQLRAVADGTKARAQGSAEVERLCEAAGRVFTGQDPAYAPAGPFHTQGHVMYAIRTRMAGTFMGQPMVSAQQVVRDAFAVLAMEVYGFVGANVDGTASDEVTQARVDALVEDWTTMLMAPPAPGAAAVVGGRDDG